MLYEGFRSGFDNAFHVHFENNFNFPSHIHRNYELIVMLDGELIITVNDIEYTIRTNEALIVFPYQRHSYRSKGEHRTLVFIFSSGVVPFFHRQVEQLCPICPIFSLQHNSVMRMIETVNRSNYKAFEEEALDLYMRKGLLYAILSSFIGQCELEHRTTSANTTLLERILILIDSMPIDQISLQLVAEQLNYEYSYISKCFRQSVGITFTNYVNQYRIHVACQMLQDGNCKVIDVAM